MSSLPKHYDAAEAESRWQARWRESGVYAFRDDCPREKTFVLDTPPPTISGVLHMGHIFSYTQADFIARYRRMRGFDVFYPMGFDDNGLPTERLVEKIKGVRGSAMERSAFVALCREVVEEAVGQFRSLFQAVALSVDWNLEYHTISDRVTALSQASFLDLCAKGEAYRDFRPTYWDWVDQTAIASAEIENKEMPGVMHEIQFVILSGAKDLDPSPAAQDDKIVIATTRPELLGACVAVMYHPEDPNAARYAGKHAVTPLFGVRVPMIADELVERDKGTGLVMCCTFGDDTDKEWWRKHGLPMRPILGMDGKVDFENDLFTASFVMPAKAGIQNDLDSCFRRNDKIRALSGLKPKQAHTKTVELLTEAGALLKSTPITHSVKCAERSGTPIEIIPTRQWYIRIVDKKAALLKRGAECTWHPEYMRIRLDQWIEGLKEDWCISRQRFFGVPFPVWYKYKKMGPETAPEDIEIVSAHPDDLPADPLKDLPRGFSGAKSKKKQGYTQEDMLSVRAIHAIEDATGKEVRFVADQDVMDTWATSSLTPEINAQSLAPNKLFPADLRPQAHEIIRSWAFYTIVKAELHAQTIPWKNVMISGWCLAADKSKMSKSKGNVVTPEALIVEKSADAVRHWASTSRLGQDSAFSEEALKIGRKLVTKLWNASHFVNLQLEKLKAKPASTAADDVQNGRITEALDVWILAKLHWQIRWATEHFEQFEYCDARVEAEAFFWNLFCDNYLELVKARAYGEGVTQAAQQSALHTLRHCLDAVLRLFAPFVPHVTEEIYSHVFAGRGSVHARGAWPKQEDYPAGDDVLFASGMEVVEVLAAIRKEKSAKGVSIKFPVERVEVRRDTFASVQTMLADLKAAGNVTGEIVVGSGPDVVIQLAEKDAA